MFARVVPSGTLAAWAASAARAPRVEKRFQLPELDLQPHDLTPLAESQSSRSGTAKKLVTRHEEPLNCVLSYEITIPPPAPSVTSNSPQ